MSDVSSFLEGWMIKSIKNKDIVRKEIVKIVRDKEKNSFVIHYKSSDCFFFFCASLSHDFLDMLPKNKLVGVVSLNNKENINFMVNNWKKLVQSSLLKIYFVNPFSKTDKVWILSPHIHDQICDRASLAYGIKAMSEMVEPVSESILQERLKSEKGAPDR